MTSRIIGRKRSTLRTALAGAIACLLLTTACADSDSGGGDTGSDEKGGGKFTLAVMTPTVGPGAVLGAPFRAGVAMAVKEINAAGGIEGAQVAAVNYDLGATADTGNSATTKALDTKPNAVLGYPISTQGLAAKALLDRSGIPSMFVGVNMGVLKGGNSFGILPDDGLYTPSTAIFAAHTLKVKRAAVMYSNNDYGIGGLEAFKTVFEREGGEVVLAQPHAFDATNVVPQVSKIPGSNADVIVAITTLPQAMAVMRARAQLDITLPTLNPPLSKGTIETAPAEISNGQYAFIGAAPALSDNPKTKEWAARFEKESGMAADVYATMGYDAVHLLQKAAATGASSDDLAKGLRTIKDYEGVYGPLACDEHGRFIHEGVMAEIQNQGFTNPVVIKEPDLSGLTIDGIKF